MQSLPGSIINNALTSRIADFESLSTPVVPFVSTSYGFLCFLSLTVHPHRGALEGQTALTVPAIAVHPCSTI